MTTTENGTHLFGKTIGQQDAQCHVISLTKELCQPDENQS